MATGKSLLRRWWPLLLASFPALSGLPAVRAVEAAPVAVLHRVLYLFDPSSSLQARRLQELRADLSGRTDVELLPLPRVTGSGAGLSAADLSWLQANAARREDRVRVENLATGQVADGAGADAASVAARVGLAMAVSTDVTFSTWGKVKELFR